MFPWSTIINQVLPADNWVRSPRSSRQQPKRVAGKFRWLNDDNMQPNQTCPNAVHICARVAQIIGLKHQVLIFFLQVWSLWHHGISRGVVSHTLRRSFKIKWTNFGERNVFTVCIPTSILTYARPILTWDCQVPQGPFWLSHRSITYNLHITYLCCTYIDAHSGTYMSTYM